MSKTLRTSCRLMTRVYFLVVFFIHDIVHSPVFQKAPFTFSGRNLKFFVAHGSAVLFVTLH